MKRWAAALAKPASLLSALLFCWSASGWTNLYSTRFERSEGYNPTNELVGQNGWTTDSQSLGGNGLVDFLGTQAAYVGYWDLQPRAGSFSVWQPIDFSAVQNGNPIVRFSVRMAVIDSGNGYRDDFCYAVYNTSEDWVFSIFFNNEDLGVYYSLDDTYGRRYSGVDFTNDVAYTLTVNMDVSRNRWWAALDSRTLATNQPITTVGAPLTFTDVAAIWLPYIPANPGDNFMVFDNYEITADISPTSPPLLTSLGFNPSGQYRLRVNGASGYRYAVETTTNFVQWSSLRTNTATNGVFEFTDTSAAGRPRRLYRARLVP